MDKKSREIAIWGKGGKDYPLYDKLKFYLVRKSIERIIPSHCNTESATLMDVGCGYDARLLTSLSSRFNKGIGLDFEVSPQLKGIGKYVFLEGDINNTIRQVEDESVDVIVFLSILEHMDNPLFFLSEARRILKPGGRLFFCSPTWIGKWVLEVVLSNRIMDPYGETPKQYNSHKMYYSVPFAWPLLVKAGFVSTEIKLWRSNFFCSLSGYAEKS